MLIQSKRHLKISVALACTFFILSACKSSEQLGGGTGIGTGSGAVATPTVSASATPVSVGASVDAELYFKLDTAYDAPVTPPTHRVPLLVDGVIPSVSSASACSLPIGTTSGSDAIPAVTHTCEFHVPELELYYSNANFIYGSNDNAKCKLLKFDPYFYELSAEANPPAPGSTPAPAPYPIPWTVGTVPPVPCYGNAAGFGYLFAQGVELLQTPFIYLTLGCLNGPATKINGFPTAAIGLLGETKSSNEFSFSVPSAYTAGQASNRWLSNDTASKAAAGASYAGEYRLNSIHGYTVQCLNQYGVLMYEMTINIVADHTLGPPAALYKGWR